MFNPIVNFTNPSSSKTNESCVQVVRQACGKLGFSQIDDNSRNNDNDKKGEKMNGFSPDFDKLLAVYPRKIFIGEAWETFCRMEPTLPEVSVLIAAVKAEISANGGKYLPGLANWLKGRRWLDVPTVEESETKPKDYRDALGNPTANPQQAATCSCGSHITSAKDGRYCPACGRNFPLTAELPKGWERL